MNDAAESSMKKLGTQAAAEAAVRLPHSLLPFYLRALRLEERWPEAASVIESLEKLFQLTANLSNYESLSMKFAWLSRKGKAAKRGLHWSMRCCLITPTRGV